TSLLWNHLFGILLWIWYIIALGVALWCLVVDFMNCCSEVTFLELLFWYFVIMGL
ncbi:26094_t:CDS:1, partial [Racocetra persica]